MCENETLWEQVNCRMPPEVKDYLSNIRTEARRRYKVMVTKENIVRGLIELLMRHNITAEDIAADQPQGSSVNSLVITDIVNRLIKESE